MMASRPSPREPVVHMIYESFGRVRRFLEVHPQLLLSRLRQVAQEMLLSQAPPRGDVGNGKREDVVLLSAKSM